MRLIGVVFKLFLLPANDVWGKVMLSQAYVSHSGGACLPLGPGISASGSRMRCTTGSRWVCLYMVVHTLLDTHPDTHSPRTHTDPWTQPPHTHPRQTHTHPGPPSTVNKRTVRILLEFFLVRIIFYLFMGVEISSWFLLSICVFVRETE